MFKYKIIIEYDGTNYVGWQRQENGISIQEELEKAILKLISENVTVYGAGRTDSGVHALGQVAHFESTKEIKIDTIRDGLNQHLRPNPIAIIKVEKTNKEFHARFSAKLRCYEYRIINRRSPLTLENNRAWCIHKKLDIEKIFNNASSFKGKHNLSAFRSINCQSNIVIKSINSCEVIHKNDQLIINVCAKSFLHSQIRIMVGTLIDISKGIIKKSISEIIKSKDREMAGMTAPPHGLYLKKIEY